MKGEDIVQTDKVFGRLVSPSPQLDNLAQQILELLFSSFRVVCSRQLTDQGDLPQAAELVESSGTDCPPAEIPSLANSRQYVLGTTNTGKILNVMSGSKYLSAEKLTANLKCVLRQAEDEWKDKRCNKQRKRSFRNLKKKKKQRRTEAPQKRQGGTRRTRAVPNTQEPDGPEDLIGKRIQHLIDEPDGSSKWYCDKVTGLKVRRCKYMYTLVYDGETETYSFPLLDDMENAFEDENVYQIRCPLPTVAMVNNTFVMLPSAKMTLQEKTALKEIRNSTNYIEPESLKLLPENTIITIQNNEKQAITFPGETLKISIQFSEEDHDALEEILNLVLKFQLNNCKKGIDIHHRRWDPKIISLCLTLFIRSPQAYDLKKSGFLELPSKLLLQYYNDSVKQTPSFLKEMEKQNISEFGRHGGIIMDEMSIQDDVIITKSGDSWNIVGIVDMDNPNNNLDIICKGKKSGACHSWTNWLQMAYSIFWILSGNSTSTLHNILEMC
ncbi:unnamed protein product [Mytilus coruscus]|uniref:Uncharacterized protein n=1 Tax=Mytilus coruscus TaxID=42192 RepID=A0A6J8BZG3_MYTCO|nr:unnamed protein product [Mytilus coruscus]